MRTTSAAPARLPPAVFSDPDQSAYFQPRGPLRGQNDLPIVQNDSSCIRFRVVFDGRRLLTHPPHPIMSDTRSILMMTEWTDPRFQQGVARFAKEADWHLFIEAVYINELPWGWQGDGCITMLVRPQVAEFITSLNIPTVDTSHQLPDTKLPRIHEDDLAIGELAAEYLLEKGFHAFAWHGPDDHLPVTRDRLHGYEKKLNDAGYEVQQLPEPEHETMDELTAALGAQLAKLPKPTALFCVDDRYAVHAIQAALEQDLKIPEDLAILGVGNLVVACEYAPVPLSSINLDAERHGYEAARLLDRIMAGETITSDRLISPLEVIERKSTNTLATENQELSGALDYIVEHHTEAINVDDIANGAGISRRHLNYLCKTELECGPAAILEKTRVDKASYLLRSSNETIDAIALQAGFGNTLRFHRAFKRHKGIPPAKYRTQNR